MQSFVAGQANTVYADVLSRENGDPITVGTVNFYLIAQNGAHAGLWFRASDGTWQSVESIAGVGTHKADGHWLSDIIAAAWVTDVIYQLYIKESNNLHISCSEAVMEFTKQVNLTVEGSVTEVVTLNE